MKDCRTCGWSSWHKFNQHGGKTGLFAHCNFPVSPDAPIARTVRVPINFLFGKCETASQPSYGIFSNTRVTVENCPQWKESETRIGVWTVTDGVESRDISPTEIKNRK